MNFEDMDHHVTVCLEQGDKKRKDILIFLRKYEDLTDSQLHRSLGRLHRKGLVKPKRYGIYGLTEQGKRQQRNLPESILEESQLTPVTNCLASEHHRATYRLSLDAVISKHLLKDDDENWVSIILAGDTQDEKTINARAAAWTLGFDHKKISYSLPYATPGDFGIRRFPEAKGEFGIRVSSAFSQPLLILEELDKVTDRDVKANIKYLLQGEREVNVDGNMVPVDPVSLILFNLQKDEGPERIEKMLGREYIRRSVVLNTKFLKLNYAQMNRLGRKIIKLKKKGRLPQINLSRLKMDREKLAEREMDLIGKLLYSWTKEGERGIMDTSRVAHLVLGRLARSKKLPPQQAIYDVVYDYLLTRETIGTMEEGWKEAFTKEAHQVSKLEKQKNYIQAPPLAPQDIEIQERVKKIKAKVSIASEFKPQHRKIMTLVQARIKGLQNMENHEIWPFLLPEEKETFTIALDAFKVLKQHKIKEGNYKNLKAFKVAVSDIEKTYYSPLGEIFGKASERQTKYKQLMTLLETRINQLESLQNGELWQFLLPEEKEKLIVIFDTFKSVKGDFAKMKEGGWVNLEKCEDIFSDREKRYDSLLKETAGKVLEREMIKMLKEVKDDPLTREDKWDTDRLNAGEKLDDFIANFPILTEEQKRRIREHFPEAYKTHKKVRNTIQLLIKEHLASEQKQKNELDQNFLNDKTIKALSSHINGTSPKKNKLGVSSKPKREPNTVIYPQKYYKEHPVEIIDQTEYRYTIRDASGKDISVPKSEVIFKNKES